MPTVAMILSEFPDEPGRRYRAKTRMTRLSDGEEWRPRDLNWIRLAPNQRVTDGQTDGQYGYNRALHPA